MQQGWLAPSFAAALEAGPQALLAHAQQVAPGVFAFDMLSEGFCTQLLAELARHEESGLPVVRPNPTPNPTPTPALPLNVTVTLTRCAPTP